MKYETKLLTPRDVGKILGFKPRTITRWCREGLFPSAKKVGRVWRIETDDSRLHLMLNVKVSKELRDRH
jgi:predicted site-specific integrase-resolvase